MDDPWDDDEPVERPPPRRPRRWRRLLVLVLAAAAVWQLPLVAVLAPVRDWPLQQIFAGVAGRIRSGGADWGWFGPITYRGLLLETSDGQPLLAVDELSIDRSPLTLLLRPADLGVIRIRGGRLSTAVWQGGSTIETVLEPWLARQAAAAPAAPPVVGQWGGIADVAVAEPAAPAATVELIDCTIELIDLRHSDTWWIDDLAATIPLRTGGGGQQAGSLPIDAVVGGRIRAVGKPTLEVVAGAAAPAGAGPASVAGRTAATVTRDGGWSLTVAANGPAGWTLAASGTRLPAAASRLAASRFGWPLLAAGLLDLRADLLVEPVPIAAGRSVFGPWQVSCSGHLAGRRLAVRDAATQEEQFVVDRLELPFDLTLTPDRVHLKRFAVETSLGRATAEGTLRLPGALPRLGPAELWSTAAAVAAADFAVAAELDLAAIADSRAGGIPLRPDVRVTGGTVAFDLDSSNGILDLQASVAGLTAIQATQTRSWPETCTASLRARRRPAGQLQLTAARLASAAAEITARNQPGGIEATWRLDLGRLFTAAAELLDVQSAAGPVAVAGTTRGRALLGRGPDAAATTLAVAAGLERFSWSVAGRPVWEDELVVIDVEAVGNGTTDTVVLDQASLRIEAGGDVAAATLAAGCRLSRPVAGGGWPRVYGRDGGGGSIDCSVTGRLDRWQARVCGLLRAAGVSVNEPFNLAGQLDCSLTIGGSGAQWQLTKAEAQIESFTLTGEGLSMTEPRVLLSVVGSLDSSRGLIDIASAEVLTATASLRTNGLQIVGGGSGDERPLDQLRGRLQWQADLARLQRWLDQRHPRYVASGRVWGTIDLLDTAEGLNLLVALTGSQLGLAVSPPLRGLPEPPRPVWTEPQLTATVDLTRPATTDRLLVRKLTVESSTLGLAAAGSLSDLDGSRRVTAEGTLAMNLGQLSRLLAPASGGLVQLTGGEPRPFAIRGSLGSAVATAGAGGGPVALPVPQPWRQQAAADSRGQLIALPRGRSAAAEQSLIGWLGGLTAETTLAWRGGRLGEFPVGPGELPLRLIEGQLAFGPFDIPVSGGRIRGGPWLQLVPPPGELVLPPGRHVDHVVLTPAICRHYLGWLSPILRGAAEAAGRLSAETGGGRLPLADPLAGQLEGRIWLEDFAVEPGDLAGPLVNLLTQLQSVVDPRFAFGDRAVLLRARPEPIQVWLADGRVHHDNLVLDMGQLAVRSEGSVGRDGSLAMQLEVAFRGDLAGATPVVAQLLRTPFVIPLRGTVRRPQFDATAIDTILGRILENTADAVLRDGIGRGLEALFGNPQPPRQPQPTPAPPLTFPEGS